MNGIKLTDLADEGGYKAKVLTDNKSCRYCFQDIEKGSEAILFAQDLFHDSECLEKELGRRFG